MDSLARLDARVESLGELRELMRAMRALAAAHVQSAQTALGGIRRYVAIVESAIAQALCLLPEDLSDAYDRFPDPGFEDAADLTVLIASEHGFVGAFDERLLDAALAALPPRGQLAVVGRRAAERCGERGRAPAWQEPMATQADGVSGVARRITARLAQARSATLVYAQYTAGGDSTVTVRRVLPPDPTRIERRTDIAPPLHQLPVGVLLQRLANEYLLAELAAALMESFASENGARLQVMAAADRNIDDRLQGLAGRVQRLRQEAITAELLDLMTGAEAARSEAGE